MRIKLFFILLSIIFLTSFYSCSDEDDGGYIKKENQENEIRFKVYSNTSGVPVTISEFYGGTLVIKDYWEGGYVTKQYGAQFSVSCQDETVLLTGEIYVNGKLRLKKDGNKYIQLIVNDIKR
ncbi:MAG: hypothetical protein LBT43_03860 [Prevotella sp.]|jgi:hypothetical protein|nr:hypothetical protein [Prevotella sp.]